MPLTETELANNYYLAVVVYLCDYNEPYVANDPQTSQPWAFVIRDDGDLAPDLNPYIGSWDVKSHEAPTSQLLMALVDMTMVAEAKDALYPQSRPGPELEPSLAEARQLLYEMSDRLARLETREMKADASPQSPTTAPPAPTVSRRSSLDSAEFEILALDQGYKETSA